MPSTPVERDILGHLPFSINQQVGGNPEIRDFMKEWMGSTIQGIGEKGVDVRSTKLTWRQADIMDNQQVDFTAGGSFIAVGGNNLAYAFFKQTGMWVQPHPSLPVLF